MGFFVICAGVVLLQLSKSAKDVPDTAVFAGDLDQVRTIAEQEQPETEPKADAIRGTAAIVRRFSQARQKREAEEFKRLHEEKMKDLASIGEEEQFEWDGLRRRRTTLISNPGSIRTGHTTTPFPVFENPFQTPQTPVTARTPRAHPPLGMSQFPDTDSDEDEERPNTGVSLFTRAKSIIGPSKSRAGTNPRVQSPMHPVPLTEISIPAYNSSQADHHQAYYGHDPQGADHTYGLLIGLREHKTDYEGAGGETNKHITIVDERTGSRGSNLQPGSVGPTPPPHSARRQFSFQNVFRKGQSQNHPHEEEHQPHTQSRSPMVRKGLSARKGSHSSVVKGATEEERLGLVKGDTRTERPTLPEYDDEDEDDEYLADKSRLPGSPDRGPKRNLTPPRKDKELEEGSVSSSQEEQSFEQQRQGGKGGETLSGRPLPAPPNDEGRPGAFL